MKDTKHYAVIDLEMCYVPKSKSLDKKSLKNEIIQIGVVLLDSEYKMIDEYQSYVSPDQGKINDYIRELTGICEHHVESAPKLLTVLREILAWLPKDTVFVQWSENDKKQLQHEFSRKIALEEVAQPLLGEWLDCQAMFAKKLGVKKRYRLSEALEISDTYYDGNAHDALSDARNTARLFRRVSTEETLELNPFYFGEGLSPKLNVMLSSLVKSFGM